MNASERKEYIATIRTLPAKLEAAIENLSESQIDTPYGEGKWTPRQVVYHLADAHMNAMTRMKLVVTENKPILKPYDQDKWAVLEDSKKYPVQASVNIIKGLHERWAKFLDSLPEDAWAREGIHLENGKVKLEDLLKTYARHCDNHLQQILTFKKKIGLP